MAELRGTTIAERQTPEGQKRRYATWGKNYYWANREKCLQQQRERRLRLKQSDPELWHERCKANKMRYLYGITLEQRNEMEREQGGLCKLCKRKEKLFVDHNHETDAVRGLLCCNCNFLVGFVERQGLEVLPLLEVYLGITK